MEYPTDLSRVPIGLFISMNPQTGESRRVACGINTPEHEHTSRIIIESQKFTAMLFPRQHHLSGVVRRNTDCLHNVFISDQKPQSTTINPVGVGELIVGNENLCTIEMADTQQ